MSSIAERMVKATTLHQSGQLSEAAELYKKVLQKKPKHAEANHLLGLALYQMGQAQEGIVQMQRGIDLNPKDPGYYSNLGSALKAVGRLEEAVECFEKSSELNPSFLPAYYNAGEAYCQLGRYEEGERAYVKASNLDANIPEIWANLGICRAQMNKHDEALEAYGKAIALDPENAMSHFGLAHVSHATGRFEEAKTGYEKSAALGYAEVECELMLGDVCLNLDSIDRALEHFERASALGCSDYTLYNSMALCYLDKGDRTSALESVEKALSLEPNAPEALCTKSGIFNEEGKFDEAARIAQKAVYYGPESEVAHNQLGTAYRGQARLEDSKKAYLEAIRLNPDHGGSYNNLALTLELLGEIDEMERNYGKALELDPENVSYLSNFATGLIGVGRVSEAEKLLRQSIELDDNFAPAWGNLGRTLYELGEFEESRIVYLDALRRNADEGQTRISLAATQIANDEIDDETLFGYHQDAGRVLTDKYEKVNLDTAAITSRVAARGKIRLGFASGDFKTHSVAYFLLPLFENIDRSRYEIYCYSSVPREDETTEKFKQLADEWRPISKALPQDVTNQISEDQIDILIELSGNTAGNCLESFAQKPAPIQVKWLGYAHSPGLEAIDYRIVDPDTDPEGITKNVEELVRLPQSFISYQAPDEMPEVSNERDTSSDQVVFASYNNIVKLTKTSVRLFAMALRSVEGSKLLLKSHQNADAAIQNRIFRLFEAEGIERDRIELLPRFESLADHFSSYSKVDVALDTYPYNGTTTTCEALSMGVPVVTLVGTRHAARVGNSLLKSVDLDDCIAETPEAFGKITGQLAKDTKRLQQLRSELRTKLRSSHLGDPKKFVPAFEEALENMWQRFEASVSTGV